MRHLNVLKLTFALLVCTCIPLTAATTVWAGTSIGLFQSADGGATWQFFPVTTSNPLLHGTIDIVAIALDPQQPSSIYFVATVGAATGFYRSTDNGNTWSATNLVGVSVAAAQGPTWLAIDPALSNVIYIGSGGALRRSKDSGSTWTVLPLGSLSPGAPSALLAAMSVDPSVSGVVYASALGDTTVIFKSTDFGDTWEALNPVTPSSFTLQVGEVVVDPRNSNQLYVGNLSPYLGLCGPSGAWQPCGLFQSADGGQSWASVALSGSYRNVVFDPVTKDMYVSASGVAGIGTAIFKSSDGGKSWNPINNQAPDLWLLADPSASGVLLGFDSTTVTDYVFRSTDGGVNWDTIEVPPQRAPGAGSFTFAYVQAIAAAGPPRNVSANQTPLPHVADGNGFDTLIVLINTGTADASYSLQFFNQSGAPVTYPLDPEELGMTGVIHPGAQAIVRTTGSGSSTNLGWGQLTAPASIKGMVLYQQVVSASSVQEGSAPIAAPSQHFFVPFDNISGATTSIGFVNPSASQSATVNFTVRYESGGTDNVPAFNMNPLQQIANTVPAIWSGTTGKRGMIEVTANVPIGLVAFRFQGASLTLVDTIAPTAAGSTPVTSTIAHTADGNNFRSTFILTNSGTVDAPYTLSIFSPTGQPQTFDFDVANALSGTVPAGSTRTIDTTGLGSVTNLGWAQLSAPPAVSGIEVFRQTNPGQSEQQATIPITQTNLAHFFLPFYNIGNTTSLALANPDPTTTATVNVTLRYFGGTSSVGQITLPPRNYIAYPLSTLFPATAENAGVAEFTSNIPVAPVEVLFNFTQAFTSLRAVGP